MTEYPIILGLVHTKMVPAKKTKVIGLFPSNANGLYQGWIKQTSIFNLFIYSFFVMHFLFERLPQHIF